MQRTWTRIRIQHGNPPLARRMLEEALLGAIVRRAGKPGEIDQHGYLGSSSTALAGALHGLRWQIQVEVHLASCRTGLMAQFQQLAAERGDGGFGRDGHGSAGFQLQLMVDQQVSL